VDTDLICAVLVFISELCCSLRKILLQMCMEHAFTNRLLVVYLTFKFNWTSCILIGKTWPVWEGWQGRKTWHSPHNGACHLLQKLCLWAQNRGIQKCKETCEGGLRTPQGRLCEAYSGPWRCYYRSRPSHCPCPCAQEVGRLC
jgi:hypothetical protein